MMKRWIFALVLVSLQGQATMEGSLGGRFIETLTARRVSSGPVNPDNVLGQPQKSWDSALALSGDLASITFRARANQTFNYHPDSQPDSEFKINELNRIFYLSDDWRLSVGKRLMTFDMSYVNQPLGFLQKRTDLTDMLDSNARAEGLPMVTLTRLWDNDALTLIYSDDFTAQPDGFNRGLRQWLLNYRHEMDNASLSLLARHASDERFGTGMTGSMVLTPALQVYFSGYVARGTARPILGYLTGKQGDDSHRLNSWRENDGRLYPRLATGLGYTTTSQYSFIAEYDYDRRGLSSSQWHHYQQQIASDSYMPNAGRHLQAQDAAQLQTLGTRQHYLYLSASRQFDQLLIGLATYTALEDGTTTLIPSISYDVSAHLKLSLKASIITTPGNQVDAEGQLIPFSRSVSAQLFYFF